MILFVDNGLCRSLWTQRRHRMWHSWIWAVDKLILSFLLLKEPYTKFYADFCFSHTTRQWKPITVICFPVNYDLSKFKCNRNGKLVSSLFAFLLTNFSQILFFSGNHCVLVTLPPVLGWDHWNELILISDYR